MSNDRPGFKMWSEIDENLGRNFYVIILTYFMHEVLLYVPQSQSSSLPKFEKKKITEYNNNYNNNNNKINLMCACL